MPFPWATSRRGPSPRRRVMPQVVVERLLPRLARRGADLDASPSLAARGRLSAACGGEGVDDDAAPMPGALAGGEAESETGLDRLVCAGDELDPAHRATTRTPCCPRSVPLDPSSMGEDVGRLLRHAVARDGHARGADLTGRSNGSGVSSAPRRAESSRRRSRVLTVALTSVPEPAWTWIAVLVGLRWASLIRSLARVVDSSGLGALPQRIVTLRGPWLWISELVAAQGEAGRPAVRPGGAVDDVGAPISAGRLLRHDGVGGSRIDLRRDRRARTSRSRYEGARRRRRAGRRALLRALARPVVVLRLAREPGDRDEDDRGLSGCTLIASCCVPTCTRRGPVLDPVLDRAAHVAGDSPVDGRTAGVQGHVPSGLARGAPHERERDQTGQHDQSKPCDMLTLPRTRDAPQVAPGSIPGDRVAAMAKFLIEASYTNAGVKGVQSAGGSSRRDAVKAARGGRSEARSSPSTSGSATPMPT